MYEATGSGHETNHCKPIIHLELQLQPQLGIIISTRLYAGSRRTEGNQLILLRESLNVEQLYLRKAVLVLFLDLFGRRSETR